MDIYYIANPGLYKHNQPVGESKGTTPRDKGRLPVSEAIVQSRVPYAPRYVVIADNRPQVPIYSLLCIRVKVRIYFASFYRVSSIEACGH